MNKRLIDFMQKKHIRKIETDKIRQGIKIPKIVTNINFDTKNKRKKK